MKREKIKAPNLPVIWMSLIILVSFGFSQSQEIDDRVMSIAYWQKLVQEGIIPAAAGYQKSVSHYQQALTDSNVAITNAGDVTQSTNSVFANPLDAAKALNSNISTDNPVTQVYGVSSFYTADSGGNWNGDAQAPGGNFAPAAAIDLNGTYYIGHGNNALGQSIARSINEGANWAIHTVANLDGAFVLDKNHLWVDNSPASPFEGDLYSAWTNFGGAPDGDIEFMRSTNGGVLWGSRQNISSAVAAGSHNQGVNLQTGPNGELYAAWAIYDAWPADENALGFARSVDGGVTWTPAARIFSNIRGIRDTGVSKNMAVNSFPVMAVDINGGSRNGWIYLIWANVGVPGINSGPDIDIYFTRSLNGGNTWSVPTRVNQDPSGQGREHFFPWITCDPVSGELHIIFYDDRNVSPGDCEVVVATSRDGGDTWQEQFVSDSAFTPQPLANMPPDYFGYYLGISAYDRLVYPVWTDNRSGTALSYTAPFAVEDIIIELDIPDTTDSRIVPFVLKAYHHAPDSQLVDIWIELSDSNGLLKTFVLLEDTILPPPDNPICIDSTFHAPWDSQREMTATGYVGDFTTASLPVFTTQQFLADVASAVSVGPATMVTSCPLPITIDYTLEIESFVDTAQTISYRCGLTLVTPENPGATNNCPFVKEDWCEGEENIPLAGGASHEEPGLISIDCPLPAGEYVLTFRGGEEDCETEYSLTIDLCIFEESAQETNKDSAQQTQLLSNFPDPFNPSTTIPYTIGRKGQVTIRIYNILGQEVITLVDREMAPGEYQANWHGRDANGNLLSSGMYFYHMKAGGYQETRRMLLSK